MQPENAHRIPWRILIVTLIASTLSNMDQSLFGYAVPGVMGDLNIGLSGIGLMISASFAFAIVSAPALASWVPRIGAPAVLALAVAGSAVFVGLQALAKTTVPFAVLRVLGFGISAAIIPVSGAYLASNSPDRGRSLLIAVQQCGYPLGWFVASVVAVPLMRAHGWRSTFLVAFAVVPLAALIYAWLPRARATSSANTHARGAHRPAWAQLLGPRFRRLTLTFGIAFVLYGGAIGGTSFYLPTFFQQTRGYDAATAAQVVGLSYAIGMLGYIGAAVVSEVWLSRLATVVLWLMFAGVGLMTTIWLPHTVSEDTLVFGITTVFFYGASSIMLTSLLESYPPALRASAAALAGTACISLGFVVFPLITAGAVKWVGWTWSFTLVIVPAVFVAGLLMWTLPRVVLLDDSPPMPSPVSP
jgi:MFS family permease